MKYSIIIPAYNEAKNLPLLLKELSPIIKQLQQPTEVLIVDDGSKDHTPSQIKKLKKKYPYLSGLQHNINSGKSAALQTGFQNAQGNILVTMDADLQDDPQDLPKLISKIEQGYDLVAGRRMTRSDTPVRRISTKLFNVIVKNATKVQLQDYNCGFKAYRSIVVQNINVSGGMHRFLPVIACWQGFKIAEIPVKNRPRLHGKAKYGLERSLKGFLDLTTLIFLHKYSQRPLRLFGTLGLTFTSIGFLIGLYLTYLRFIGEKIGERPLLILSVLLMVLGVQFFSLGLIGELLATQNKNQIPISKKI